MKEIRINSYNELIEKIQEEIYNIERHDYGDELLGVFFRGQQNKDWNLIPGLLRNNENGKKQEKEELQDYKNVDFKIALATAQHYGKSTRCLDFTRNYKIALYFACNPNDDYYNKDGAIFILSRFYHRPNWFTNYLMYYAATINDEDISLWTLADKISKNKPLQDEFNRTHRSLERFNVAFEIEDPLGNGFMVDFNDSDNIFGADKFKRIKKQEAALYFFGSKIYAYINQEKHYLDREGLLKLCSTDDLRVELHNISHNNLENEFCTKIIIPYQLKKEIFEKININASDLGL